MSSHRIFTLEVNERVISTFHLVNGISHSSTRLRHRCLFHLAADDNIIYVTSWFHVLDSTDPLRRFGTGVDFRSRISFFYPKPNTTSSYCCDTALGHADSPSFAFSQWRSSAPAPTAAQCLGSSRAVRPDHLYIVLVLYIGILCPDGGNGSTLALRL